MDDEVDDRRSRQRWAASGAMSLTGPESGPPLGPPAPLVTRLDEIADVFAARSDQLGRRVVVDPVALLAERAAIAGLQRRGRTSCGGATRLLPTADGWLAVALVRPEDIELVPAWLHTEASASDGPPWDRIEPLVARERTAALVERAALLGLPVGALPTAAVTSPHASAPLAAPLPLVATEVAGTPVPGTLDELVVADLSGLWAGPLCGSLLADAGARVVKVESIGRPDGARRGPAPFFDLLNAGKRSLALDLTTHAGRSTLRAVLERVDVIIEASRPRALEQLGIDALDILAGGRPRVWVSITGHGRGPGVRDRVGFGDDAAVAGGLVAWNSDEPVFCADAVADPASGLVAAAAVLDAVAAGGSWLLDVAMSGVAAHLAGPTLPVPSDTVATPPEVWRARGVGPQLGADTGAVLDELGVTR